MSTVGGLKRESALTHEERFPYGFREVARTLPDGTRTVEPVPLTLEEWLHPPHEEDVRLYSEEHGEDCRYLVNALKAGGPRGIRVLSDHRVAWDDAATLVHCPDVVVFEGPAERRRPGGTYFVQSEGARPLLIIEIVSPDIERRHADLVRKPPEYHRAGVPLYVAVDTQYRGGRRVAAQLLGFRHTPGGYQPLTPDDRGWLWLDTVGLWLKLRGVQTRLCDRQGVEIGDYNEVTAALTTSEEQARAAAAAHGAAEDQARAEAAARAAAELQAQAAAAARAAAEERAQAEAAARAAAEARIRELEDRLRREGQG